MCAIIETGLLDLAKRFKNRIPEFMLTDIINLIHAREWGVGLENMCENIFDNDVVISVDEYRIIEELGSQMGLEKRRWKKLLCLTSGL